jgi:PKD repeat protein
MRPHSTTWSLFEPNPLPKAIGVLLLFAVLLATIAAVSSQAKPPGLRIGTPKQGQAIKTTEVTVKVKVSNQPKLSQLHFLLDGVSLVRTPKNRVKITDLSPGSHTVTVELVNVDGTLWSPPAQTAVTFTYAVPDKPGKVSKDAIIAAAAAGLEPSATSGKAPLTVNFGNRSKNAKEFQWDLGDGTTRATATTEEAVSHIYRKAGTYTAKLTASKPSTGGSPLSHTKTIAITVAPGPLHKVTVTPTEKTLTPGETHTFAATALDQFDNEIKSLPLGWSVSPGGGNINPEGIITGGTRAGKYEVRAEAAEGPAQQAGTAAIVITPGPLDRVKLEPGSATVEVTKEQKFAATALDRFDNPIPGLSYTFRSPEGAGKVEQDGKFTAGTKAGVYPSGVTVEITQGSVTKTATTRVTIQPGPLDHIKLQPALATVLITKEQQFTAEALDQFDNPIPGLIPSFRSDSPAGRVDSRGNFTAGTKAGVYPSGVTVEITQRSVTKTATIRVTVPPGPLDHVKLEPALATVLVTKEQQFTATALDRFGNPIPGLISSFRSNSQAGPVDVGGKFIAGTKAGLYATAVTVEISQGSVTKTATARVIVRSSPLPLLPTAMPRPVSGADLVLYAPSGWESPLIVSSVPKAQQNSTLVIGGPVYMSFAVQNEGKEGTPSPFFADLLFDGIVVKRTNFNPVRPGFSSFVVDWADLTATVRITPGKHRVSVVVDPTDLVVQSNENDNVFEHELEWAPAITQTPTTPTPTRKPNLAPFRPDGWDGVIVTTSVKDAISSTSAASGPLSVDAATYLSYGLKNVGLTSIASPFWVYTYLDGVLVDLLKFNELLSDYWLYRFPMSALAQTIPLTPGLHAVRIEIDATRLIDESDETDNVFEEAFFWNVGQVPPAPKPTLTPTATAPAPLTLPNLVPFWRYPSDGPIIVSTLSGRDLDDPPVVGGPVFIKVVARNQSTIPIPAFAVDLYFDGSKVQRFFTPGPTPGGSYWLWDWDRLPGAALITPGKHTLKIVIDPDNQVAEADEADNGFEKVVIWGTAPAPSVAPPVYTEAQLDAKQAGLAALLDVKELAIGGATDYRNRVLAVADAGYYLVTGKSLLDEPVQFNLLTGPEYRGWTDNYFAESRFAVSPASEYPTLLKSREKYKYLFGGYYSHRFGKNQIVVKAEVTPARLLRIIIHEAGHLRKDLLNPKQAGSSDNLKALFEAEAQQWEVVVLRALEKRTGLRLSAYPDIPGYHSLTDRRIDFLISDRTKEEHVQGYLLQWGAALADDVPGLRQEVLAGPLTSGTAHRLYDFLIKMPASDAEAYVNSRVQAVVADNGAQLKTLARRRLVSNLATDLEGSSDLRLSFLTVP